MENNNNNNNNVINNKVCFGNNNNHCGDLSSLPYECIVEILKHLSVQELQAMFVVCTHLNAIARDNVLWMYKCLQQQL
jgi:hypothetical protein